MFEPKKYSIRISMIMTIKINTYILHILWINEFLESWILKKIINPKNINKNLKKDKYFINEFWNSMLLYGNMRIEKLKKIINILLFRKSIFFNSLMLRIAYKENMIEKKFNAAGPKIIKIGKENNKNFNNKSVCFFNKFFIIYT